MADLGGYFGGHGRGDGHVGGHMDCRRRMGRTSLPTRSAAAAPREAPTAGRRGDGKLHKRRAARHRPATGAAAVREKAVGTELGYFLTASGTGKNERVEYGSLRTAELVRALDVVGATYRWRRITAQMHKTRSTKRLLWTLWCVDLWTRRNARIFSLYKSIEKCDVSIDCVK